MTAVLTPITFDPPEAARITAGLYGAVQWEQDGTLPLRFLDAGVVVRTQNTGLDNQVGLWDENWLASAGSLSSDKKKDRTTAFLDEFVATTVYAYDHNYNGDLTAASRGEVAARASRALDLLEPIEVETILAARLVSDAGSPSTKTGLLATVSYLEGALAAKGLQGHFHIGAQYAAHAANLRLNDNGLTPHGHRWVFGGGYVGGLGTKVVVTTKPYGWRGPVEHNDVIKHDTNQYIAVAERSLVIGYEAVLAAAVIG